MQAEPSVAVELRRRVRTPPSSVARPGPGSVTWRLHRERIVLAGWGRAVLLQLAHPLIAAGVEQHSTFRGGPIAPWRRLHATVRAMLALTFGSDDEARGAAARILGIHDRVKGVSPHPTAVFGTGHSYSAHDPRLLAWVNITLLDSTLLAFEQLVSPLSCPDKSRYCVESRAAGGWLGLPPTLIPDNASSLEAAMRDAVEASWLEVTPGARQLARDLLSPPLGWLGGPASRFSRLATIGWLPDRVRRQYGFSWGAADTERLRAWVQRTRRLRARLPPSLAHWRAAAARRAAGSIARER